MPALKPHKFKIDTKVYYVNLPDVYDNTNYSIGKAFGITKVTADAASEDEDGDTYEVSALLKAGRLIRMRVSYTTGTGATAKRHTARVVCPIDKASKAITKVRAEKYNGVEVTTSGIPRRRRLG